MKKKNRRLALVYIFSLVVVIAVIINVFLVTLGKVHIRSNTSLEPYVQSVALIDETIWAKRGNIYDNKGQIVAQDEKTYDIICYLNPNRKGNSGQIVYVDDPLYTSQVLSSILDMDQQEIYFLLTNNPNLYQTELGTKGRNLSEETVNKILSYPNLHGIGFKESNKRIYTYGGSFAPYLVGFAQSDEEGKLVGKMGLEKYLNEELSGIDGAHIYQQDKNGYVLPGMYEETIAAKNGCDVYLTIDNSIQQAMETSFEELVRDNNASQAWSAVMEIQTGKILAWGQYPSFNPNTLDIKDYQNKLSQAQYEPGSVMKSIIYATAMDIGVYDGEQGFDSSPFCFASDGNYPYRTYSGDNYGCINNAGNKNWGWIPLDYGLIYSSNVATSTLLTDYVGPDKFSEYLDRFGFFKAVDTDGIEEETGTKNFTWPADRLALTYGQGSSVTTLQLLQAYSAIFGNGEMVKPYFIDKVVDTDSNTVVYRGKRTVSGNPIKESTAKQLQALLERVVSDPAGTAQFYAIDEVKIMAKTGTSEIAEGVGYNSNDSITSVMLAFPADNPKYMMYYAYVSPYDYYNHTYSKPITNFIKKVAILTNVGYEAKEVEVSNSIVKHEMPNVLNETYTDANNTLSSLGLNVIKIGNNETVIGQYPKAGDTVYTKSKVFVITEGDSELPNFNGWTRKELINYWNVSGIQLTLDGYGVGYEQSVDPGTLVNKNTSVTVKLKEIDAYVDISKKEDETTKKTEESEEEESEEEPQEESEDTKEE